MADVRPVISPAQFGENLFARVFAPETIVRQLDRSIAEREIAIENPDQPVLGPIITTSTTGTARIAPLGLRVLGPGRFDALVHVEIKPLTVTFNLGGVEMWDIDVDTALQVQLVLHEPLGVRIELVAPQPEAIQINCQNANDNWMHASKGGVEAEIRKKIAKALADAVTTSEAQRTIDLERVMKLAIEAPQPVVVALGNVNPADEAPGTGLQIGVQGAYVHRDTDGDWILRARAAVRNPTAEPIVIGRDRFVLAGWSTTSGREGDFPSRLVLPPGAFLEGDLGYYVPGDRPAPRAVWLEVAGFAKVPWRREVQVAEAPAPPLRNAPWPPGGRIDCAPLGPAVTFLDGSHDVVVSVYLALRNRGYASVWLPDPFFGAVGAGALGSILSSQCSFGDGLVLPPAPMPDQGPTAAIVSWYWKAGTALGDHVELRFGPPRQPYVKLRLPVVPGASLCTRT